MDFRHFRTFAIAAEELHFARTAERLGIAQPAVTQQIKLLEAQLGFKVFHRVRRGIELTEAGQVFLEHVHVALTNAETAILAGRRASRGELGSLCIAYVHSAMLEPELPALLRYFAEARPQIDIELRGIAVHEQLSAVADERIDVAFLRSPPGLLPETVRLTPFSRSVLDIVLPPDHWGCAKKKLQLRELAQERFIVVDDPAGVGLGHQALELCMEAGFEPRMPLRVSDSISIVSLVAAGLGVGLVPRSLARFGIANAIFKPLAMANCHTEILIATRQWDRSPATQFLLRAAQMTAASGKTPARA